MRNQNLTRIYARTKKDDLLTWYYLIFGDETSEFKGGLYMGRLVFPGNYPLAVSFLPFHLYNLFPFHSKILLSLFERSLQKFSWILQMDAINKELSMKEEFA